MTHQRPAVVQLWDGEEGFTRLGYEPLGEHPTQRPASYMSAGELGTNPRKD